MEAFIRKLEWDTIRRESVLLNPRQFVEGLQNGKNGVYDRREEDSKAGIQPKLIQLVDGAAVERYITQNPSVSVQSKINMLNERLLVKLKDEFLGKGVKYTEEERKAIVKAYRGYYGGTQWRKPIYELYTDFLMSQKNKGIDVDVPTDSFDVYDLAALALLYKLVKETEVISEAHHIVIDEAQDFGMMAYRVLYTCIKDCTYTVMGDVSQNIHFGYGLGDWEALRRLLLSDPMDSFGLLRKSYRNTVEISDFATNILKHGSFSIYPVEPIIRHGKKVEVEEQKGISDTAFAKRAAEILSNWQKDGYDTIAVVCRDKEAAQATAKLLSQHINILDSDLEKVNFGSGILVLPVEYTKGLEFDAVLIWNPTREDYPSDDGDAKLLYVAATRALHELHVLYRDSLTGLIAAPVPEKKFNAEKAQKDLHTVHASDTVSPVRSNAPNNSSETKVKPRVKVTPRVIIATNPAVAEAQPLQTPKKETTLEKAPQALPTGCQFGDMPVTEKLRPAGHAKINLLVRWVSKQTDGLYLQSQYGTLRISPVSGNIIRMTFAKGTKLTDGIHPLISACRVEKSWKYRDAGKIIEFTTGEVNIRVDKLSGAVSYLDTKGIVLLNERKQESRILETDRNFLYLDWQKGEQLFAMGPAGQGGLKIRGSAYYISKDHELPFLLSDKGYGILPASSGKVICCDVPAYGSYLSMEDHGQQDYYFIAGKQQNIMNAYSYLCGTL